MIIIVKSNYGKKQGNSLKINMTDINKHRNKTSIVHNGQEWIKRITFNLFLK